MTPPICVTTRQGPGCGHETSAHDGNPLRACDCCSRAALIRNLAVNLNRQQRRKLERVIRKQR